MSELTDDKKEGSGKMNRSSKIHELKVWPEFFNAVKSGRKRFEIRKDDREFEVGDFLVLREYYPPMPELRGGYTRNSLRCVVTYKIENKPNFGLMDGYCILGISDPI